MMLGIIQGLTEFLPVSSSAHLILFPRYFGWTDPGLAFDVALHLGTLLGVLAYFRKDLAPLVASVFLIKDPQRAEDRSLTLKIMIATIPGAVAGLLLEHRVESTFRSVELIAFTLMIMGTLLALADYFGKGSKDLNQITMGTALLLGVSQSLALVPGVSRSGITITVALALGLQRTAAARFSFLMSIPIIAGAGLLKAKAIWLTPDKAGLALGFTAAAISGFLAIWVLMRYVEKHRYTPFVIYRWALGIFVLLNLSRF
jgi:undecaprenyl-diphosphatase